MMIEVNHAGDRPGIAATAGLHPSAVVIGNVEIGGEVYIGPNAVIRADEPSADGSVGAIIIEREANIQDGVIIHALGGTGVRIGRGTSIAHGAVVHGPSEIGENCFIGFNSVIFKASLGDGVIVLHQALIEDAAIPNGLVVPSMTAVRDKEDMMRFAPVSPELAKFALKVRQTNVFLAEVSSLIRSTGKSNRSGE